MGTELTIRQEGVPDVIPAGSPCYLGWQQSLDSSHGSWSPENQTSRPPARTEASGSTGGRTLRQDEAATKEDRHAALARKNVTRAAQAYAYVNFTGSPLDEMQRPARDGFPALFRPACPAKHRPVRRPIYNYRRIDMENTLDVEAGVPFFFFL